MTAMLSNPVTECPDCGTLPLFGTDDPEPRCVPCLDRLVRCGECGDFVDPAEMFATADKGNVCEDCADDFTECERCERLFHHGSMRETASDGLVCDGCRTEFYFNCDDCRVWHSSLSIATVHGDEICESCYDDSYFRCESCDEVYHTEYGIDGFCDQCHAERGGESDHIHGYSYKPSPEFRGTGPLYLGLELEIETSDVAESAEVAVNELGQVAYLKEDASIAEGFEIVTHPMSYEYAMNVFNWDALRALRESGAEVNEYDNGLHVHVSREAFDGPAHTYRWLKFIYRNESALTDLARRNSRHWAAFSDSERKRCKDAAKGDKFGRRYSAVNTQPTATYELRFFASTLEAQEARAALAFAHASVEYARVITAHDVAAHNAWSWDAFRTWVVAQGIYPDLVSEMDA